ncbi:hypothetical protein QOT17_000330 [Balamuthia mandrillaris]
MAQSAWNQGAWSWEERDYSKWASAYLKEQWSDRKVEFEDGWVTFNTKSASGDASVLFLHGKKRTGYDLQIKLEWEGELNAKSSKGTVHLEAASDDNSFEVQVKHETGVNGDSQTFKTKLEQQLRSLFAEFLTVLAAK